MKPYFIVHHTDDSSTKPQFDKVNSYHRSKGFKKSSLGFHGGYQFFIERDGTRLQYRAIEDHGSHTDAKCGDKHCNVNGIGVCLAGDFTTEAPTEAQLWALYWLWQELQAQGHASIVVGHRDVKATACPGFDAKAALQAKRREDISRQLKTALAAVPRVAGARMSVLLRWIERTRRLLSSPPSSDERI